MQICGVTYPHQPNQIFVCHFVTEFKFTDLRGEKVAGKVTDGLCEKVFDALPMISTVPLKLLFDQWSDHVQHRLLDDRHTLHQL